MTTKMVLNPKDPLFHNGHRKRLREKVLNGTADLNDTLEHLLTFAVPRRDLRVVARTLLCRFGGIHQVLTAPYEKLIEVPGVGDSIASLITTLRQLNHFKFTVQLQEKDCISNKDDLYDYVRNSLMGREIEEMHILYLDAKNRLIEDKCHATGTSDYVDVYTDQVAIGAVSRKAKTVIMVHNHPNTTTGFSTDDIKLTQVTKSALKTVRINLADHLVVARGVIHSMAEDNYLKDSVLDLVITQLQNHEKEILKHITDIANNA